LFACYDLRIFDVDVEWCLWWFMQAIDVVFSRWRFWSFFVIPVWSLPYLQFFWIALRLVWFGGQWISCFANATTL
jgi:hypothetical protein